MSFRPDHHNDPNEAYEVVERPAWLSAPPADWWTVLANGIPLRHYPPHRKDVAIQYATDPAYRALLAKRKLWEAAATMGIALRAIEDPFAAREGLP
jgi:hypothetical protein